MKHKNQMKKRMKMTMLMFTMLIISQSILFSQLREDLRKEVLVYIKQNALTFPVNEQGALTPAQLDIPSQALRQALNQVGIETVAKVFPDFTDDDTTRVTVDGRIVKIPHFARIFRFSVYNATDVDSAIASLNRLPVVLYAEKNMNAYLGFDAHYNKQWHLNNTGQAGGSLGADIDAEAAWSIYMGNTNIKIGVIDGGVELNHDDLDTKSTGDTFDPNYNNRDHGTHVAGIAAGIHNNIGKIKGVDANVQIISKRIFETGGYVGDAAAANKIISAVDDGANILNNSWGSDQYSTTIRSAFVYAYNLNRVAVAIMHNYYQNGNPTVYPAAFDQGIIAVGATTNTDVRATYSQTGNHIDVTAPGGVSLNTSQDPFGPEDIYSSITGNSYTFYSGTSMAAPQVSGIASLLIGYAQDNLGITLYNDDVEQIIRISTDKVSGMGGQDWTTEYGTGRVNARKALNYLQSPYLLNYISTTGGSRTPVSGYYTQRFIDVPGLPNGFYWVKKNKVDKTVTYPNQFATIPHVWGRGVATQGFSEDPEFGLGYCEPVNGTITNSGVTLRTYIYEVREICLDEPENCNFVGWFPSYPDNVIYGYTVLGIETLPIPENFQLTISSNRPFLSWDPVNVEASILEGYHVYRKIGSDPWARLTNNPQNGTSFLDNSVQESDKRHGVWIEYHVTAVISGQESAPSNNVGLWGEQLQKSSKLMSLLPKKYDLGKSYPNPFNPISIINYSLPEESFVTLKIYNLIGKEIKTLLYETENAGFKNVVWDSKDDNGIPVPSGVYIFKLTATSNESGKSFTKSNKMVLLK